MNKTTNLIALALGSVILIPLAGCKEKKEDTKSTSSSSLEKVMYSTQYGYVRHTSFPAVNFEFLHSFDFTKGTYAPEGDFTQAEINLMIASLSTLSDDALRSCGINYIMPVLSNQNSMRRSDKQPDLLIVYFTQPNSRRPLDPELGNKLVDALFAGRRRPPNPGDPIPTIPVPFPPPFGTSLMSTDPDVTSPNPPTSYTAVRTPEGSQAILDETTMVDRNQDQLNLTHEDRVRPHGSTTRSAPTH